MGAGVGVGNDVGATVAVEAGVGAGVGTRTAVGSGSGVVIDGTGVAIGATIATDGVGAGGGLGVASTAALQPAATVVTAASTPIHLRQPMHSSVSAGASAHYGRRGAPTESLTAVATVRPGSVEGQVPATRRSGRCTRSPWHHPRLRP